MNSKTYSVSVVWVGRFENQLGNLVHTGVEIVEFVCAVKLHGSIPFGSLQQLEGETQGACGQVGWIQWGKFRAV
jgi:hypothetical protein